jgi:hypothetical protein
MIHPHHHHHQGNGGAFVHRRWLPVREVGRPLARKLLVNELDVIGHNLLSHFSVTLKKKHKKVLTFGKIDLY